MKMARHFFSKRWFIDGHCAIYDGGLFGKYFCGVCPKEHELQIEHQGDHATFLDLHTTIKQGTFIT